MNDAQSARPGSNTASLIDELASAMPELRLATDADSLQAWGRDWTRFREPAPAAVAFPENAEQVRDLVRWAARHGLPLVPSGGRTGLSGGAVAARGELVVSMDRIRRILDFDPVDSTVRVEAGVVTASLQAYAAEHGLCYPVSFASEGSSQIGGNIATNAGGVKVLRHGLTRDRVRSLLVVTGSGELMELNRGLVKNASGYDLRHLFIGSEGTLGLIVEATLSLVETPPEASVMLLGLEDLASVMQLFAAARGALDLSAFEFLTREALAEVMQHAGLPAPMDSDCAVYALLEFDNPGNEAEAAALALFEQAMDQGWVHDGVISQSEAQAKELWRYREGISEAITPRTPWKHDLSLRISRVPAFLAALDELMAARYPELEMVWFGHIGDGNLHMNILRPEGLAPQDFEQRCHEVDEVVFRLLREHGGSISAEHGIGLLKQPYLSFSRSEEEIALMRHIKQVFDPAGIMNPGKLLGPGNE